MAYCLGLRGAAGAAMLRSPLPHPLLPGATLTSTGYARKLGLFSATMMVIGGIIGSGIFLNPAVVAQRVPTERLTLAAWAAGALVALLGAFVFAELGRRRPRAGGGYAYLKEAFGPLPGFLYAWALLLAIATGAAAAVAMTSAGYLTSLLGWEAHLQRPVAAAMIIALTLLNIVGVRPAAWSQNLFTILKLAAIAVLVVTALFATAEAAPVAAAATPITGPVWLAFSAALVPVLFAFGGWQQTNFVAEEMVAPERDLPRALVIGVVCVAVCYLLVNVAYIKALGIDGLAASIAPAADTMEKVAGPGGRTLIAAGIVASTFGFLNLVILVTPRVYQAMARDGLFFQSFAKLHPRWQTPVTAILVQGAWAITLLYLGSYGDLLDWVVFADWIFFGSVAATLFVLRKRDGDNDDGGFRTPLHPWSTLLFIAAAVYVMIGSITSNPGNALRGALLLAAGVPVFLYWRSRTAIT